MAPGHHKIINISLKIYIQYKKHEWRLIKAKYCKLKDYGSQQKTVHSTGQYNGTGTRVKVIWLLSRKHIEF